MQKCAIENKIVKPYDSIVVTYFTWQVEDKNMGYLRPNSFIKKVTLNVHEMKEPIRDFSDNLLGHTLRNLDFLFSGWSIQV